MFIAGAACYILIGTESHDKHTKNFKRINKNNDTFLSKQTQYLFSVLRSTKQFYRTGVKLKGYYHNYVELCI